MGLKLSFILTFMHVDEEESNIKIKLTQDLLLSENRGVSFKYHCQVNVLLREPTSRILC